MDRIMRFFDRRKGPAPTILYKKDDSDVLVYGTNWKIIHRTQRSRITDLLLAEQALREQMQREETLQRRATALQKVAAISSEQAELQKANDQLEEAEAQYSRKQYALYRAESMLSSGFKELYDSLRHDTTWFMSEGMIQDCSDQSGCCSRECGCCLQRHSPKGKRVSGHCTSECWCCISFRGFDLPEEEKEEIRKDFRTRLEVSSSQYLRRLASWFFCPTKPKKPKSAWKKVLHPEYIDKKTP